MLSVSEWARQSIEKRKGRTVPFIIPANQYRTFEAAGVDMSAYAIPEQIPYLEQKVLK